MFILPAFNQTIQRLAGPGLGHNTRHIYVGDGIGDVVRPLISAWAKAAGRLAAKGLAAARNLGVELFQAAKPVALCAATEVAATGKDILQQRAQDLFVPRAGAMRKRVAEAGKSILRQRAQDLPAPGATRKPSERQRATIQQRAQDLLAPRRAGPRKRQRATIQQKARQLLSGRAAKNLDTLIWGQGLRLSPY